MAKDSTQACATRKSMSYFRSVARGPRSIPYSLVEPTVWLPSDAVGTAWKEEEVKERMPERMSCLDPGAIECRGSRSALAHEFRMVAEGREKRACSYSPPSHREKTVSVRAPFRVYPSSAAGESPVGCNRRHGPR